jgi:hypothetical protein
MRRGSALLEKRSQVEGYVFVGLYAVWDQKAQRMERNVNVALECQRHAQFIFKGRMMMIIKFLRRQVAYLLIVMFIAEMPRLVDVNAGSKRG